MCVVLWRSRATHVTHICGRCRSENSACTLRRPFPLGAVTKDPPRRPGSGVLEDSGNGC